MIDAFKMDRLRKLTDHEYLKPPDNIPEDQLVIWNQLVKSMPPGFYIEPDRFLIMSFIKCNLLIARCEVHLENEGYVIIDPKSKLVPNPWIAIRNSQNLLMLRLAEKLRITTTVRVESSGGKLKKELMANNIKAEEDDDPRGDLI